MTVTHGAIAITGDSQTTAVTAAQAAEVALVATAGSGVIGW